MIDIIALLQTLTLPAGATTGARIELGQTPGTIKIFNSSGQLVGELDPTGVITVFDPAAGSKIEISPTNPASILFTPASPFGAHSIGTGSIGTDEKTVPDRARVLIVSPSLDGRDRSQITLEEDTGSGASVFVSDTGGGNDAHFQVFGDINGNTDSQVNGISLPRGHGATAFVSYQDANIAALTSGTPFMTGVVFNAVLGRRYRVKCHGNFGASVANARASADIFVGATRAVSDILVMAIAGVGSSSDCGNPEIDLVCVSPQVHNQDIAPGTTTVDFILTAITAAVYQLNASVSSPAYIKVEDVGPVSPVDFHVP